MNKANLRKKILEQRNNMSENEVKALSSRINKNLIDYFNKHLKSPALVCVYYPKGNEVDIREFIEYIWEHFPTLETAFPRVNDDRKSMDFFKVNSFNDLEKGIFGLKEPNSKCKKINVENAIIITPAVACNKSGFRIGYGAGFYDRYFNINNKGLKTFIAPLYEFQTKKDIDLESHDISMNYIVTEENIIKII